MSIAVTRLVGLMVVVCTAIAIPGCGGDDGDDSPTVADIPSAAVALVGDEPVTRRQLDARLAAVRRSQPSKGQSAAQLRRQAMSLLLRESVLEQEAARLDVSVGRAQVRERVDRARRQFKTRRQFEQFLGGQTESDLIAQLRLQALAERVAEESDGGGSASAALRQVDRRWRERTVCRPAYLVPACGNGGSA